MPNSDVWSLVLQHSATDRFGNMTVPGLALVAYNRSLSSDFKVGCASIISPYDAEITFAPNGASRVPTHFKGGLHFSDFQFAAGLAIIRDRATGQMFAVSHSSGRLDDSNLDQFPKQTCTYYVRRIYPLARLAQLLGGHTSEWSQRLPHLHSVSFHAVHRQPDSQVTIPRNATVTSEEKHVYMGIVAKNQIRGREWTGEAGQLAVHLDDFISHRVVWGTVNSKIKRKRTTDFVLASSRNGVVKRVMVLNNHETWYTVDSIPGGLNCPETGPHALSLALGWYCDPLVANGPGWVVSLLSHGKLEHPNVLEAGSTERDLMMMATLAMKAQTRAENKRAQVYHPTKNPNGFDPSVRFGARTHGPRAAKQVAKERILQCAASGINITGSFAATGTDQGTEGGPPTLYQDQMEAGGPGPSQDERDDLRGDADYVYTRPTKRRAHAPRQQPAAIAAPMAPVIPDVPFHEREWSTKSHIDWAADLDALFARMSEVRRVP